ncbi:MAG TPA: alpha-galactosidase [Candidatus Faecalibacterium avium]|uniref:alpha-galactosidase n=1 Tax=Faecalibacterium sp. An121 TaxID=1965550 RepID=UPI000B375AD3|nr:alpha-galactosidase [Faecalibacterium sp. An121]OUQ38626.1 alpha-galactosidase [Faecalibacterium sp. An121]HIV44574.1 alpha-galactosidase [Candidatus Faecalibacterium avium]
MSIRIDHETGLITLHTLHTSYQMWADGQGVVHHLYYGPAIGGSDLRGLEFYSDCGFSPQPAGMDRQRDYSLDTLCQEYTGSGVGDYRIGCLRLAGPDGSRAADLRFVSAEAVPGKYTLPGLPAACAEDDTCETLRLKLRDAVHGLTVTLLYGVFAQADVITRAALLENEGNGPIRLDKAASACLDLPFGPWELIHFHGRHCMERQPERVPLSHNIQTLRSARGASSHQHNPFAILAAPHTTEEAGECLGAMLVWSGNFKIECEVSQMQSTRLVAGVSDDDFSWTLEPGGQFAAPEVLFCYSDQGLSELSARYHRFLQRHIIRSPWRDKPRPVLINNWEATYMDFDAQRIWDIARQARDLGVEMLVLDDGWFGERSDDSSGLGDWQFNEKKLGCTFDQLIGRVREMGLLFGLWIEPEMVCTNTALYAAHPDWALTIPGRAPATGRSQLVLDLGRPEVVDYLYSLFHRLLAEHDIAYIKWDMNRNLTDVYSRVLPPERQGEAAYRYMLGLYSLLDRLTRDFPQVLFEGCAGGGGRFDAGMLCYCPQIWCSDDTDAIHRIKIQYGTSFGYPPCTMGSHVSASPNHQTGRSTPLSTRAVVAMAGTFGYELDLQKLTDAEKEMVKVQIAQYKQLQPLLLEGRCERLTDAVTDTCFTAWQFTAPDRSRAAVSVVVIDPQANPWPIHVRLRGLDPQALYHESLTERVYTGAALCHAGLTLPILQGDFPAVQIMIERTESL